MTMNHRARLILGWTVIGVLGRLSCLGLARVASRPGDESVFFLSAIVVPTVFSAAIAYAQGRWARILGLRLNPSEFAILVGLATLPLQGLNLFGGLVSHGRFVLPLYLIGSLIAIAAPVHTLKAAGVRPLHWWIAGLIGMVITRFPYLALWGWRGEPLAPTTTFLMSFVPRTLAYLFDSIAVARSLPDR